MTNFYELPTYTKLIVENVVTSKLHRSYISSKGISVIYGECVYVSMPFYDGDSWNGYYSFNCIGCMNSFMATVDFQIYEVTDELLHKIKTQELMGLITT